MNIPNVLTTLRFILVPVFAYFLCIRNYTVAVILFLFGGLTDVLDGFIARKCNMVTSWGKVADPLADKLMQFTALVVLSLVIKIVPASLLVLVFIKEVLLGIGAIVMYRQHNHVAFANRSGKAATVIFYLAIVMLIFDNYFGHWAVLGIPINQLFLILAIFATLFAFFSYLKIYLEMRQEKNKKTEAG